MQKTASIELEIPFHDVDALHVVWHGHYAKYYELASMNLLRQNGLDILVMRELGYSMYVMETRFRYMHPLAYLDRIKVTSELKEWDTCIVISNMIHKLRPDGQRSDGQRSDGQRPDGQRSDGQRSDGQRSDGQRSDGQRSEGQRCARGRTSLVLTDAKGKLLLKVPNEIRDRLV